MLFLRRISFLVISSLLIFCSDGLTAPLKKDATTPVKAVPGISNTTSKSLILSGAALHDAILLNTASTPTVTVVFFKKINTDKDLLLLHSIAFKPVISDDSLCSFAGSWTKTYIAAVIYPKHFFW